ncbi:hypothetical protein OD783_12930, partial [Pseudomonas aeruginosa]
GHLLHRETRWVGSRYFAKSESLFQSFLSRNLALLANIQLWLGFAGGADVGFFFQAVQVGIHGTQADPGQGYSRAEYDLITLFHDVSPTCRAQAIEV